MGKKRQKKGEQESPNVAEATRIRVSQVLEEFRAAKDVVYTFEENLSNHERAVVHELCRKLGMRSRSSGKGNQRRLSVFKTKGNSDNLKGQENLRHVSFSQDAQAVLQELFTYYPPGDGEIEEKSLDRPGGKTGKNRANKDDIFRKPVMSREDIAKKVESLASRMKKAANLQQVSEQRLKLPIASYKEAITSTVEANQVVLISGETGCGKTTQVPQYLLDHMWSKTESCKIICTQPRRISATSVSERISYERGQNIGEDIGYKIRLESKGGRSSSVVFCTNGVLLRVLVSRGTDRYVPDITHIIVDEIHERDCYSDFMLAIIRDMLPSNPHLRLILMSATLDAERFSQYFGGCPVICVPGFTYPVKTFYLEDVLSFLKSVKNNHLESAELSIPVESELMEEDKAALDEAINLAWTNDEFDTLLDLVSTEGTIIVHNYQHSLTGLTPLMVFAAKGRVSDVCMLLSVGADCHLRSKDGMTALQLAERENQLEVAQMIREHSQSSLSNSQEQQQFLDKYMATINPEVIDVSLMVQLMRKICADSDDGAILVFLPGWDDINKTRERLLANPFFKDNNKFIITSLHSMVPAAEQRKAFKRTPLGCRKIVLATNIAESAITIDDVVYVIDSGRMKEKSYDPYNNVSTLQSSWVSKANAKQRQGRAGRCQPGICYHLYSKLRAESLPDFQVPEIKRMPIEELCLQVKLLDPNCKIQHFLQKTLDPPVNESIHNAIIILQDIGALSNDEGLTELGEKLGHLPVHPLTSKMLFLAILLNCLDPALTLACASDYKEPFTLPMLPHEKKKAAAAKYELSSLYGGQSDHLAVIAALECWRSAKQRGQEARFCSEYFVSSSTMNMLDGMRKQLQSELVRHRFIPDDVSNLSLNARDPGILHAVLVAGLYPMVGRLIPFQNNKKSLVETASGSKVRLIARSLNFKLSIQKKDDYPLLVYDEITRGDGGMHIKSCTVVGPLPLLLFATEIAVAPAKHSDNEEVNDDEDDEDDEVSDDEDDCEVEDMEVDKSSARRRDEIMSSPDNEVKVVVDRWLSFRSRALDVAQMYCLRERLSSSILFKVKHPCEVLPPVLGASMHAIACVLSYDGLSGISSQSQTMESLTSMVHAAEIDESGGRRGGRRGAGSNGNPASGFLRSLFDRHNPPQNFHSSRHSYGNQQLVGTRQQRPRSDIGTSDLRVKNNYPQVGPKSDSFKRQRGYKSR